MQTKLLSRVLYLTSYIILLSMLNNSIFADTQVSGNITQDTIWSKINSPYIVTGHIYVFRSPIETATLTIEPGVEIRFDPGCCLYIGYSGNIGNKGALIAQGTVDDPIIFTSNNATPAPGDWRGIYFGPDTDNSISVLDNCIVEYAGNGQLANIYLDNAKPLIKNNTIWKSSGWGIRAIGENLSPIEDCKISDNGREGIYFHDGSASFSLVNNEISNNNGKAVSMPCNCVQNSFSGNHGSGNSSDYIEIRGGNLNNATNTIWKKQQLEPGDFPVVVTGSIYVFRSPIETATLTIEPGVEIRFDPGCCLYIGYSGNIGNKGALIAQGTVDDPIIFTSNNATPAPGDWRGIYFGPDTDNSISVLDNCIVEYGGNGYGTNIFLSNASPTIKNCTIQYSSGKGIILYQSNSEIISNFIRKNLIGINITAITEKIVILNNFFSENGIGLQNDIQNDYNLVDARHNYWGHPSGPYDPSDDRPNGFYNPTGQGDKVSDYVLYSPWTGIYNCNPAELSPDTVYTGNMDNQKRIDYYSFTADAGKSLLIQVTPISGVESLYFSDESGRYFTETKTPRGTYDILIPQTEAKTYRFFIYDKSNGSGCEYSITARYIYQQYLSRISLSSAPNTGQVTMILYGLYFAPDSSVTLKSPGLSDLSPENLTVLNSSQIRATFNFNGAQTGLYSVWVENSKDPASVLENAFEINPNILPGHLKIYISTPQQVRPDRQYTAWIYFENDGGTDIPVPLLLISNNENSLMRLTKNKPFRKGPIQILGTGTVLSTGILCPGDKNTIPVYFKVPLGLAGHTMITFSVEQAVIDSTPLNYTELSAKLKPADADSETWDIMFQNIQTQWGITFEDYQAALYKDSAYIAEHRVPIETLLIGNELSSDCYTDSAVYDVESLINFEFDRANGKICPRRILAGSQDVYVPEPGFPLSFERTAPQPIINRLHKGAFGRGWYHTYEYSAVENEDGDVIIKAPGDFYGRIFKPLSNNIYQSMPGDYGQLSVDTSNPTSQYILREKNGMIWRFNDSGTLVALEDRNNNSLSFFYSGTELIQIVHSSGDTINLEYSNGVISHINYPGGKSVLYRYDSNNEFLTEVERPGGVVTKYEYNPSNNTPSDHALIKITYPDGTHCFYSYDDQGRFMTESKDNDTEKLTYTYDDPGIVSIADNLNQSSIIHYGIRGEILQVKDPNNNLVKLAYDDKSQITQLIDPDNKQNFLAYDTQGNLAGIKDSMNQIIKNSFDLQFSNLTKVTDPLSRVLNYSYSSSGNPEGITYPDTSNEIFENDSQGNITGYTNRRSQHITYTVNSRGQLEQKLYPDGRVINYTYNDEGKLTSATDSLTGVISMEYDDRGFMTKIQYPGNIWFSFEYNNSGKRTKRTSHDGNIIVYNYDNAGRLSGIIENGKELARYEYDSTGCLKTEIKGNGTRTEYGYDAAQNLLQMINYGPDNSIQSSFSYTYNSNGQRTSMTTLEGTTIYVYDDAGQLSGVTYPDGHEAAYQYDSVGNRIKVTDNGVDSNYSTNNMNQYTVITREQNDRGNLSCQYDPDGNLISKTDAVGTSIYQYDSENRLVEVQTGIIQNSEFIAQNSTTYTYDALGNRASVTHDGEKKYFINDPAGMINIAVEYDSQGNLIARYTHGLGLVAMEDSSGNQNFYSFDGLGSTRQITDSLGLIKNTYDYSAFGEIVNSNETISNSYKFIGRFGVSQEDHGLTFMRARYYSPEMGRFVSADPIGINAGDVNFYRYCGNNPVNYIDPNGLDDFDTTKKDNPFRSEHKRRDNWNQALPNVPKPPQKYTVPSPYSIASILNWVRKAWNFIDNYSFYKPSISKTKHKTSGSSEVITPHDPNEKTGTLGVGDQHYITTGQEMSYTIYFENKPTASAPAQEVFVHDYLDPNLDWSTFKLGVISFGNTVINSMNGQLIGKDRVVLDKLAVDIDAQYAPDNGYVIWTFKTLDLETGELPEDANSGFLPPEDGTGCGQGYVSFTVCTKKDLASGTVVANHAKIIFDTETPIETNEVWNTITDAPPSAPSNPVIPDGQTNVPLTTSLGCSPVQFAISYDLYLWGSEQSKPAQPLVKDLSSPVYDVSLWLSYGKSYNWQIIAKNVMGNTDGPVWSFSTVPLPNQPPVAVISGNLIYEAASSDGAQISLNASQSYDPDNDQISYKWTIPSLPDLIGQSSVFNPTLPLGSYTITLIVSDGKTNSLPVSVTVRIQDSTPPQIIITSPQAKTYIVGEPNPVLSYDCSDIFGISESSATLNGNPIENGTAIDLAAILASSSVIPAQAGIQVFSKDMNGNTAAAQLTFTVEPASSEITPSEIIEIINNALREHKITRGIANHLKTKLKLYEYFIKSAKFFEQHNKPGLAKVFYRLADDTLDGIISYLKHHSRRIDPEVYERLLFCFQEIKMIISI